MIDSILKALGIAAIIAGVAVLALVAFLVFWFRSIRASMKADATPMSPSEISLKPDPSPDWHDAPANRHILNQVESAGFRVGKSYVIPELNGFKLTALHHTEPGISGALYEAPGDVTVLDLCADTIDGTEITVSNAPNCDQFRNRPECRKISTDSQSVPEMLARLREEIGGRALIPMHESEFADSVRETYRRDTAWKVAQGGISEAEVLATLEKFGESLDESEKQEMIASCKAKELSEWAEEALASFERESDLPVREWRRYSSRLLVFACDLHRSGYAHYLSEFFVLDDEPGEALRRAAIDGAEPKSLLHQAHAAANESAPLVRLGEVLKPRFFEVYGIASECGAETTCSASEVR